MVQQLILNAIHNQLVFGVIVYIGNFTSCIWLNMIYPLKPYTYPLKLPLHGFRIIKDSVFIFNYRPEYYSMDK